MIAWILFGVCALAFLAIVVAAIVVADRDDDLPELGPLDPIVPPLPHVTYRPSPPAPPVRESDPITLFLMKKVGDDEHRHEISVHLDDAPDFYRYAGKRYKLHHRSGKKFYYHEVKA